MTSFSQNRSAWGLSLLLGLVTLGLYWPTAQFDFINLDDPTYVLQNPQVSQGLTAGGVHWAFTHFHGANWHPLTWVSHMVDVTLFGLQPAGHHLMNVGFHVANTLLLFWLLRGMTGALWRSAIVAAFFGLHPTHVESVAWVAERKDVLSTFFGLLTLLAYSRYAAESKVQGSKSKVWYGVALGLFAGGLLSKPMLVTWPFVLLLLDFWPLQRFSKGDGKKWLALGVEKIPFFALTIGSCALTFFAQRAGGAVQSMEVLPMSIRLENAVVSYARYLGKTFWPVELSAYYPHPIHWPAGVILGAVIVVCGLIAFSLWRLRQAERYWLAGIGWFLGTLVPVIGLIQVGGQSIADRYLYIPQIGILIASVWGVAAWAGTNRNARTTAIALTMGALLGCAWLTHCYLPKWRNSIALYTHALSVDAKNPPALYSLGLALSSEGKLEQALPYLEQAATLDPTIQIYQGQLALAYELKGDIAGAITRYRRCLELEPNLTEALNNLAWLLATAPDATLRNGPEAVRLATRACELTQFEWPLFLGTLAASYAEAGRFTEAVQTAEKAEQMARKRGFGEVADRNAELLLLYRANQPYHEKAATP